ncbi:hypothetical protein PGT21_012323 [Puccinia graminis f. sp. tritici]|uniref:Uncharacterized protein n=1 Tax=Puccinia graminis f. sp. tritici TaxID=56615 RepID=A0A5B0NPZ6_PUCGR|nr:hypothetical protein PGT21_012323 [Puccinia graminis f. sp. tritici]KAA1089959.1 hypothetical protein PGTUg99_031509 [Puccinia graminis f. sp. tritici]
MIWICIHFPREERKQTSVTLWNEQIPENLGSIKKDLLSEPSRLTNHFTSRYKQSQPLIQLGESSASHQPNLRWSEQGVGLL